MPPSRPESTAALSGLNRRVVLAGGLAWTSAGVGQAATGPMRRRALLVGVGEVQALPHRLWLKGPPNDVLLMRESLLNQGMAEADIRLLSTTRSADSQPTEHAVREAMATLERSATRGSQILVYFAGHGAQVPQSPTRALPESDALEEVLLLADVQPWQGNASSGRLPHALRDEELSAWVHRLCQRGSEVWVFLDTCHAAGLVRGPAEQHRVRAVSALELGIPLPEWPSASSAAGRTGPAQRKTLIPAAVNLNRRVFATAARASEPAVERRYGSGGLRPDCVHGAFTYHLNQLLRERAFSDAPSLRDGLRRQYAAAGDLAAVPQVLGDRSLRW